MIIGFGRDGYPLGMGVLFLLLAIGAPTNGQQPRKVEFNRDVRPILADHCFQCHGPDARQRQGELRLDAPEVVSPDRSGGPVIVAGDPGKSELWRRITSNDPDERMPPPEKGGKLTAAEIATLRQWIMEGAKFEKLWSLLPVRRPGLPLLKSPAAMKSPLDGFVLARLEQEGLHPSPEADRHTLLRRVTLALTGLPPSIEDSVAFSRDESPDAYERVVDRLLVSPRYGERMAVPWLDAARYADTSGYQSDGERFMWRWRDWVIEALNANMPFDQFTIEQLAGDLLPQPTLAQRIATGFNRNHRGNAEGGIIPEEYAVEYVADRVETTATVWLGLTLGCSRCHDHKYDPFTQRDFYSLFAFFNNVPEKGRAIKIGNSPPYIPAPTRQQEEMLRRLTGRAAKADEAFCTLVKAPIIDDNIAAWEKAVRDGNQQIDDWSPRENLVAHFPFDHQATGFASAQSQHTIPPSPHEPAANFDGDKVIAAGDHGAFGFFDKFTLAAWLFVPEGGGGTVVSRMTDVPQGDGYQLAFVAGKAQLNLVKRWLDDALRVETAEPLPIGRWCHVAAVYDGSRVAQGVKIFVDGRLQTLNVLLDELNQSFGTKEPLRIGGGGGHEARFRGAIDELRVYSAALAASDIELLATPQSPAELLALPAGKRTPAQWNKLQRYFLERAAPAKLRAAYREQVSAARELAAYSESLPTVMVMEETLTPRPAHILIRGQYDKPGERALPDVPAELPPLSAGAPKNRLGLARWLVDPANPLTSRVIVNRFWQLHFGTGLVKTAEDFGRQGEWPSHPDLLDWLAAEFMRDWDVKRLHRMMVTSGTFRQSSRILDSGIQILDSGESTDGPPPKSKIQNPKLLDPDNRLLSRGPRLRLPAEMVRDQALFASGMLVEQIGGPSVRPWQPPGLWSELTGNEDYQPGSGAELVRRSLYTFWKRTIPPPTLTTFDAPSREACTVLTSRTNTPLQALALLNEPTFVAATRALAERVCREAATPEERIARAMLLIVGRPPTNAERDILHAALDRYRKPSGSDDLTAYALVCSTILNLDEAITSQ